jgi:glycosyltransferase involved in cell wall biosynthesis
MSLDASRCRVCPYVARVSVTVVLPCLDEAAALPGVLAAVPEGWQALVVDNGSRDGSPELAARLGARVVHEARRGYGAPVHTGIEAATTEVVAVLDCDGSLDPAELVGPVGLVLRGEADLVVGRRRVVESRSWPWHARAGNAVLAGLIRASTGVAVHDIAPVRVARRQDLLDLGVVDRRFGYPLETVLAAAHAGWRVVEVDVSYRRRTAGGRSKVSGSVRGTLRVLHDFTAVLRRRRRPRPDGPDSSEPRRRSEPSS